MNRLEKIETLMSTLCKPLGVSFACVGIPLHLFDPDSSAARAALKEAERSVFDEIRSLKRKAEFLAGRLAAKKALAGPPFYLCPDSVEIPRGQRGEPYVKGCPRAALSISHSAGLATAAATERNAGIGIDIEQNEDRPESLIDYFFSHNEKRLLRRLGPAEKKQAVNRLWTRKEAASKAVGRGGALPFGNIDCSRDLTQAAGMPVALSSAATEDFCISIAVTEELRHG